MENLPQRSTKDLTEVRNKIRKYQLRIANYLTEVRIEIRKYQLRIASIETMIQINTLVFSYDLICTSLRLLDLIIQRIELFLCERA